MDHEHGAIPQVATDPRELALQLAVIAQRLDERSAFAVERVEAAGAALQHAATTAAASRARDIRMMSAALLVGALIALVGTGLALDSARRELASIQRDRALLQAINSADLSLCGDRLCARVEGAAAGDYMPVAARAPAASH